MVERQRRGEWSKRDAGRVGGVEAVVAASQVRRVGRVSGHPGVVRVGEAEEHQEWLAEGAVVGPPMVDVIDAAVRVPLAAVAVGVAALSGVVDDGEFKVGGRIAVADFAGPVGRVGTTGKTAAHAAVENSRQRVGSGSCAVVVLFGAPGATAGLDAGARGGANRAGPRTHEAGLVENHSFLGQSIDVWRVHDIRLTVRTRLGRLGPAVSTNRVGVLVVGDDEEEVRRGWARLRLFEVPDLISREMYVVEARGWRYGVEKEGLGGRIRGKSADRELVVQVHDRI